MKHFSLILALCSGFLYQNALGEKLDSHKYLLKQTSFDAYNEVYNQERDVFENPIRKNEDCNCENGKCVNESGKIVCKCLPGYGNYTRSYCKDCKCGPNKGCIFIRTSFWKTEQVCSCKPGYIEDNGNCVDSCSSNLCKNDGKCIKEDEGVKCICIRPWTGLTCEEHDLCSSYPCKNGGKCMNEDGEFKCLCFRPWTGLTCEKHDPCSSYPCKNGGKCMNEDEGFKCICIRPWTGLTCEEHVLCNADICIHGKCEVFGQYHRCRCDKGFTGFRCEDKVDNISDKQAVWLVIQTSILFSILILLSGMFFIYLQRKK